MATKAQIRSALDAAKTRRTLLLASVGALRKKKPMEAARKRREAEQEALLIGKLAADLRAMS